MRRSSRAVRSLLGALIIGSTPIAAQTPSAADPPLPRNGQRWVATEGVATPWVFDLIINGSTVAGEARQRSGQPRSSFGAPFDLRDGMLRGDTITFKLLYSDNESDRTVSFRGVRRGDTITFQRHAEVSRGDAIGNGIVGPDGATAFTAYLLGAGTPIPLAKQVNLRVFSVDSAKNKAVYKGFTIVYDPLATDPARDTTLAAVRRQLDLVDALLPPPALDKLHDIPLILYPASDGRATYLPHNRRVIVPSHSSTGPLDSTHAVLLHEFCHAYEDLILPGGFANAKVLALYDQMKSSRKFPETAYLETNPGEYFAVMASTYLVGSVEQEPFARDSIRVKQPAMYEWLRTQFGVPKR